LANTNATKDELHFKPIEKRATGSTAHFFGASQANTALGNLPTCRSAHSQEIMPGFELSNLTSRTWKNRWTSP
jgi:hypothetical protein